MSQTIIPALEETTIAQLRESVRGQIFTPGSDGYEEAARIWNGAYDDRRPAVIVSCTGAADVIAAVSFARGNHLEIAVRGGGHSIAGFSTGDNVMVIDLSPMNGVRVDTTTRWATVGPGAVWADVDHETLAHGLATTGGLISSTGVAGFTLGGGIGWLMRKYGLAADNLIGVDVVTADGRLLHACDSENRELFWGIRGGGGNFGIVTQFEFELHPIGEAIYAGPVFYSADADGDLLRRFREWAPGASDDVAALVNLTSAPPLPVIPQEWHGRKVAAFVAASGGPVHEGEGHVRNIRGVAEPIADLLGPMPYKVMQTLLDPLWQKGIHAYFKATNLSRLDDELIERLIALHHAAPGPQAEIHVQQLGGAIAKVPAADTAFSDRSAPYVLNAVAGWHDPAQADAHISWARAVIDAAADASTGQAYVNFLGDSGAGRSAYGEETYARLLALKREYDPTNVFARNQNIDPRASS
jgi:FAD/FMN-containing dehydrogenase